MIKDDKYVVYKRSDVEGWEASEGEGPMPAPLADAVVIRTKDPLAGPALHAYAAGAALPLSILHLNGSPEGQKLRAVADYFHARAIEADEYAAANPVKLPD